MLYTADEAPAPNGQYLDPRWQRKRLEIMQRADFACEWCGASDRTLHVHHGYYAKEAYRQPWKYPDDTLYCFCADGCHPTAEELKQEVHKAVARIHPRYYELLLNTITAFGRQMDGEPDLWAGWDDTAYDDFGNYDDMPYDDFGGYPHDDFDGSHFDDNDEIPF